MSGELLAKFSRPGCEDLGNEVDQAPFQLPGPTNPRRRPAGKVGPLAPRPGNAAPPTGADAVNHGPPRQPADRRPASPPKALSTKHPNPDGSTRRSRPVRPDAPPK